MNTANPFIGPNFVWWQGVVEDIDDPLKLGRTRVRIIGFHTQNKVEVPTDSLPWAVSIFPVTSASMNGIGFSPSGLVNGTWVIGFFKDGSNFQQPVIFGSILGIPTEEPVKNQGFNDPEGIYPKKEFLNEPDTNRLARNEKVDQTYVPQRNSEVETVDIALSSETWKEPNSPYNAEYPKNKVLESEAGHIIEIDDTPESERIHLRHSSGSFEEFYPDGSKVTKIKGDNYEIVVENNNVYIKGDANTKVDSTANVKVSKDLNIHILGGANLLVSGNLKMETRGNFMHKIKGQAAIISEGNMTFIAPRIDLNPSDISVSQVSDPLSQ